SQHQLNHTQVERHAVDQRGDAVDVQHRLPEGTVVVVATAAQAAGGVVFVGSVEQVETHSGFGEGQAIVAIGGVGAAAQCQDGGHVGTNRQTGAVFHDLVAEVEGQFQTGITRDGFLGDALG